MGRFYFNPPVFATPAATHQIPAYVSSSSGGPDAPPLVTFLPGTWKCGSKNARPPGAECLTEPFLWRNK